jgi:hypothetical protein
MQKLPCFNGAAQCCQRMLPASLARPVLVWTSGLGCDGWLYIYRRRSTFMARTSHQVLVVMGAATRSAEYEASIACDCTLVSG